VADKDEVEIKISGSVESSLGAAAEEVKAKLEGVATSATVSAAAMSKALEQAGGDLSKITPAMLGLSAATQATSAAALGHAAATGVEAAATSADTAATEVNTAAHVNSRAATEALVLVHEALSGRFTKMTGSAMILTQALAGTEATAGAVAAVMSPMGLAIAAAAGAMVASTVAAEQYRAEQQRLIGISMGVGAAAGFNATQLRAAGEAAAEWSHRSVAASTEAASAFAAAGVKSQEALTSLSGDVEIFAQLTGEKAADAQKTLADAMRDPVKGAEDLNAQLGIVDSTTMEHIRTLSELGDKEGAVALLVKALQERMDDAKAAGVGLGGQFTELTTDLSNMWTWIKKVNEQLALFEQFGANAGRVQGMIDDRANAEHNLAVLNQASKTGGDLADATPGGRDQAKREALAGSIGEVEPGHNRRHRAPWCQFRCRQAGPGGARRIHVRMENIHSRGPEGARYLGAAGSSRGRQARP
jgi:phage-related minor tail protein